jgi:hypothetical protein
VEPKVTRVQCGPRLGPILQFDFKQKHAGSVAMASLNRCDCGFNTRNVYGFIVPNPVKRDPFQGGVLHFHQCFGNFRRVNGYRGSRVNESFNVFRMVFMGMSQEKIGPFSIKNIDSNP